MLGKGKAIDVADSYGNTALMWAVRMGETAAAQALLDHGADIDRTAK